jgi:PAS domain S-box-containing protein
MPTVPTALAPDHFPATTRESRARAALFLVLALLLANIVISWRNVGRLIDHQRALTRSQETIAQLAAVLAAIADAKTQQRDYIITGREEILQRYEDARSGMLSRLQGLRGLTPDPSPAQRTADQLDQKAAALWQRLDVAVDLRKQQGFETAQRAILTESPKNDVEDFGQIIATLQERERAVWQHEAEQASLSGTIALVTIALGTGLALALVGLSTILLQRGQAERKRAERAIRQQGEWLQVTLLSIGDALVVADAQGNVALMNPVAQRLTGWSQEEALGKPADQILPIVREDDRQPMPHPLARALRERVVVGLEEQAAVALKNGGVLPIDDSAAPIRDDSGGLLGAVMVFRDMRERRRGEAARAQLAAIVESAGDAIVSTDLDGAIRTWNSGAERLYGYAPLEIKGRSFEVLFAADHVKEFAAVLDEVRRGESVNAFDTVHLRKGGMPIDVSLTVSPIYGLGGQVVGVSTIACDITARKRLEEQFQQAQKMEAVGRLAGGIAHDFNNLLTVITGYTEMLCGQFRAADAAWEPLQEISKAADQAAAVTGQLLAFSRNQVLLPQVVDLNVLLGEVYRLLRRLIGEDIEIITKPGASLHPVRIDPGQLKQVLMNLAVNARDAMPQGGTLTLETINVELAAQDPSLRPEVRPGHYVLLTVSDNGQGMDESVRRHVFEPFFTTKEPGKGTGLGLATVYGIVEQSGGFIDVDTELRRGTSFRIYLPRAVDEAMPDHPNQSAIVSDASESSLVVEDR